MEIQKSLNGYYTVTFANKMHLKEEEILREFSTVGQVCQVVKLSQRIFVRFKEKEEAERALKKFGKIYDVNMARNKNGGVNHHKEAGVNHNQKPLYNNTSYALPTHKTPDLLQNMNKSESRMISYSNKHLSTKKLNPTNRFYHLILANLPKNYTAEDVRILLQEAEPVYINSLRETRVFNIKFCHIILNSMENLTYLIRKLHGFILGGEKLIAAEVRHLLEWKEKAL